MSATVAVAVVPPTPPVIAPLPETPADPPLLSEPLQSASAAIRLAKMKPFTNRNIGESLY